MTNQTNNGGGTLESKREAVEASLSKYVQSVGLNLECPLEVENDAKKYLTIIPSLLRGLSATECAEAAFIIRQFGMYVQKALNKEIAATTWANESIKKIISRSLPQHKYASFEEKRLLAIADNDAAQKLHAMAVQSQLKVDTLNFLGNKIDNMARELNNLSQIKRVSQ